MNDSESKENIISEYLKLDTGYLDRPIKILVAY